MSKKRTFQSIVLIAVLVLVTALVGLRPLTSVRAAAIKIMPLGDSITGGSGCWRSILWNRLQNTGYTDIDFVGSLSGQACPLLFDSDNEGHGGIGVVNMANANQLPPWLAAANPDIVLMHLGTNDLFSSSIVIDTVLAAYTKLIGQMRANNPNMKIIVAQIIPLYTATGTCPICYQNVVNLNAAIPAWAAGLSTTQSPIVVVDQWTGFDTTTDTGDGIHPNEIGFQKMSDKWYPALVQVLSGSIPTHTPTITPGGPTLTPTRTLSPTITPIPSLQIKIQSAGTDTTSQTSFNLQLVNTGAGGLSNLSWRLYFTPENGNAASVYTLEKYYDQSGSATISGPTLACGNTYYYTVSYGATALPANGTWAYNTAFHLSTFASTYDSTNDWWRTGYTTGALPASFTAHTYFPSYLNGAKIYGNEPTCSGVTATVTATATRTFTPGVTFTATATRTLTPVVSNTPTVGASPTRTSTVTSTLTRTLTPAMSSTPTRTPTVGATSTRTQTPTATATSGVGACSPVTSTITAPFTFDGVGTFCWQSTNLGAYLNSWNTTSVAINGVNVTNLYLASGSYPAKIGGYWYVAYNSAVAWGHFEAK